MEPSEGKRQGRSLPDGPDKIVSSFRTDHDRVHGHIYHAGVQPLQYRGHPMWDFNREDDATRCGRKGPESVAALIKILSALYKGKEEEFLPSTHWVDFLCTIPEVG